MIFLSLVLACSSGENTEPEVPAENTTTVEEKTDQNSSSETTGTTKINTSSKSVSEETKKAVNVEKKENDPAVEEVVIEDPN